MVLCCVKTEVGTVRSLFNLTTTPSLIVEGAPRFKIIPVILTWSTFQFTEGLQTVIFTYILVHITSTTCIYKNNPYTVDLILLNQHKT